MDEQSKLVVRIINGTLNEANLRKSELARRLKETFSQAELYRVLAGEPMSGAQISALLHQAADIAGTTVAHWSLALEGSPSSRSNLSREFELPFAESRVIGRSKDHQHLMAQINSAQKASGDLKIYSPNLPLFLLEDELAEHVIERWTKRLASDSRSAARRLRKSVAEYREMFFNRLANQPKTTVITLMSGLLRLAEKRGLFSGTDKADISWTAMSLLKDWVLDEDRDFWLVILNDVMPGPAQEWASQYQGVALIVQYQCGILIKRYADTLGCRIFDGTERFESRNIIETHASQLVQAHGLACHDTSREGTARFLWEFIKAAGLDPDYPDSLN